MSLIQQIDHIAIAVENIAAAAKLFTDVLGLEVSPPEDVVEQKTRVAFVQVGEVRVELVEPMTPDSPVGKFIASRGQGIHHIAYRTTDVRGALAQLTEKGVPLIDKEPKIGAHEALIAFVHPKGASGVLTELCQPRHT